MNPCSREVTVHFMSFSLLRCFPSLFVSESPCKFEEIILTQGQLTSFFFGAFMVFAQLSWRWLNCHHVTKVWNWTHDYNRSSVGGDGHPSLCLKMVSAGLLHLSPALHWLLVIDLWPLQRPLLWLVLVWAIRVWAIRHISQEMYSYLQWSVGVTFKISSQVIAWLIT